MPSKLAPRRVISKDLRGGPQAAGRRAAGFRGHLPAELGISVLGAHEAGIKNRWRQSNACGEIGLHRNLTEADNHNDIAGAPRFGRKKKIGGPKWPHLRFWSSSRD